MIIFVSTITRTLKRKVTSQIHDSYFNIIFFAKQHLNNCTECVRDLDKLKLFKLGYGGSGLSSKQFLLLPQLHQKMTLASKVVKCDAKINSLNQ